MIMCELFGNTELFMLIWLLCMTDLLGGGASREEMPVWVAGVQLPKVEYYIYVEHSGVLNSHHSIWIYLLLLFILILFSCSVYFLSTHRIFLLLFHTAGDTGLKSAPALIT